MQDVQLSRQRNGAYGWSIARDIADPNCGRALSLPDLARLSAPAQRATKSERELHQGDRVPSRTRSIRVRRMLSVRSIGALAGRQPRPRRDGCLPGGRDRGGKQHVVTGRDRPHFSGRPC